MPMWHSYIIEDRCRGHVGSKQSIWTMLGRYAKCANYHSPVHFLAACFVKMVPPQLKLYQTYRSVHSELAAKLPRLGTFGVGGLSQCYLVSFLSFWLSTCCIEEAKEFSHPMSQKLGSRSLSNYSRDFWSFCKIPVVPWCKVGLNVFWSTVSQAWTETLFLKFMIGFLIHA